MKKLKNIELKFNDPDYLNMLGIIREEIERGIGYCTNEAQVVDLFERTIYFHTRNVFGLSDEDVRPKKEVNNKEGFITHKFVGRMDSLYNYSFVIEYKHPDKLKTKKDTDEAIEQISNYMKQLHDDFILNHDNDDNLNCGLLTDGKKVMFFFYAGSKLINTPFKELSTSAIDIIIRKIVLKDRKQLVSENVRDDFSASRGDTVAKKLAVALFHSLSDEKATNGTRLMMKEWEVLFHLSDNDDGQSNDIRKRRKALSRIFDLEIKTNNDEFRALYALQTTYAIIVKMIAIKIVSKVAFDKAIVFFDDLSELDSDKLQKFMAGIEEGGNVSLMGIRNLIEGDFFSWYCTSTQWNEDIYDAIKSVIGKIEDYASFTNDINVKAIDIFRELYMEIMPNAVRHSLGEYFTPGWLADNVVNSSIEHVKGRWRAIDPCCGSGVFLTKLINQIYGDIDIGTLSAADRKKLLQDVLDRVIGVDINPISALTARVTYVLAIMPLLEGNEEEITIPVYLGDSANPKQTEDIGGILCYKCSIMIHEGKMLEVCLPASFVESDSFVNSMHKIQALSLSQKPEVLLKKMVQYIGEDHFNDEMIDRIGSLCVQIHEMKKEGIAVNWLRIITNYMSVAKIADIDLIVGNPPWVKWEHLPQKYAEKIKGQCVEKHLFSGQSYMGAIQLNVCALIATMTASSWLKQDGELAFLMPKTMLTQDSYAGFRNFYVNYNKNERLFLTEIDDWSKAGNPFIYTTEDFATYFYNRRYVDYSEGVPVRFHKKKKGKIIEEINEAEDYNSVRYAFEVTSGIALQMGQDRTGFTIIEGDEIDINLASIIGTCDYKARTGAEFTPSEVYWVDFNDTLSNEGNCVFENVKLNKANHKAVTAGAPFSLGTKYVYPLVLGPKIKKYKLDYNGEYCIFPYYLDENGMCKFASPDVLIEDSPELINYFNKNKAVITNQSKRSMAMKRGSKAGTSNPESDYYALSKVGPYSFAEYSVAFRDNTCMAAIVLEHTETAWGEKKQFICAKHAAFISVDKEGKYIERDEAYYIAAILNTSVVEKYFKCTYSTRSYSIKNINIYIPKYDGSNESHKRLAELSKKAHEVDESSQKIIILGEIEKLYLDMCMNK